MTNSRKEELRKKRAAEQKRMLLLSKERKEIEKLEKEIKYATLKNQSIKAIRNLKISARVLQLIYPYVLAAGGIAGAFILCGEKPFYYGDEWKTYSNVKAEFDSDGNLKKEQQYGSFGGYNETESHLSYYTGWEKISDNFYTRTTQEYTFRDKTYEKVYELFGKDETQIIEVLGKPKSSIKETRNNLTEEEINDGPYYKALVFYKDENDYKLVKETPLENVLFSALYLFATTVAVLIILKVRSECSDFDFTYSVSEIKRENPLVDILELNKKLENRKENYKTLTR